MCKHLLVLMLVALAGCTAPASTVANKPAAAPTPAPGRTLVPKYTSVGADQPFPITEAGGAWEVAAPHLYVLSPRRQASFSVTVTMHQVPDQAGILAGSGFSFEASPSLPVPLIVSMPADEATLEAVSARKLTTMERVDGAWQATADVPVAAAEGRVTSLIHAAGMFGLGEALPLLGSNPSDVHVDRDDGPLFAMMTLGYIWPFPIVDPDMGPCWVQFEADPPQWSQTSWPLRMHLRFNTGTGGSTTRDLVIVGTFVNGLAEFEFNNPATQKPKHLMFLIAHGLGRWNLMVNIKAYLLGDTITDVTVYEIDAASWPPVPPPPYGTST